MGVDISHIIKNDFHEVHNHEKSLNYVLETIKHLKDYFQLHETREDEWDLRDYFELEDWDLISFRLPWYDVEFELHNGFWKIESYFHYCQFVMYEEDIKEFFIRELIFDIAKALGQSEVWHAEEWYTWNGGILEEPGPSLEEWIRDVETKYGKPFPEFEPSAIFKQGYKHIPDYEPIYHDCLKGYKEELEKLHKEIGNNAKILGLLKYEGLYLRCKQGSGFNLYDKRKHKFFFTEPVDSITTPFDGCELLIRKGDKSAVYGADMEQKTPFVDGFWDVRHNHETRQREIFNSKHNITFFTYY